MSWNSQNGFTLKEFIYLTSPLYIPLFNQLMCLPPISSLLHLFIWFLRLFSSWFLDPALLCMSAALETFALSCYFFCLNEVDDSIVRHLLCNGYIHAYSRLFPQGHDSMQKNTPPLLPKINYFWNNFLYNSLEILKFIDRNTICILLVK